MHLTIRGATGTRRNASEISFIKGGRKARYGKKLGEGEVGGNRP